VTSVNCIIDTVGTLGDERLSNSVVSLCLWENARKVLKQIITLLLHHS